MTIQEVVKCRSCTELFPQDRQKSEELYRELMKKFHPDVCGDSLSSQAAAVINSLYGRVKYPPKQHDMRIADGPLVRCFKEYDRCDGQMYFSHSVVTFVLDSGLDEALDGKLVKRYNGWEISLGCETPESVRAEAKKFLPDISEVMGIPGGRTVLKVKCSGDELPLCEALDFFKGCAGREVSKHFAWIISRLLGMCCYAAAGGFVLNCLAEENLLIDPVEHTVRLAGGWWFSAAEGGRIFGACQRVYDAMPSSSKSDGIAWGIIDLECVKAICRRIFPDDCPAAIREFSRSVCADDPFEELENWEKVINKAFGGRFFTPMKLCINDIF